jgi:hypothetical protein
VPEPVEVKSTAVPANAFGRLVASFSEFEFSAIVKYVDPLVRPPTALAAVYFTFDPVLCPWFGIERTSFLVSTFVAAKVLTVSVPTGMFVVIEKAALFTEATVYCVLLRSTFNPVK